MEQGHEQEAKDRQLAELALRVLDECRVRLMMSFRFLDRALWKMPFSPVEEPWLLATDGSALYFNPAEVIGCFRESPDRMARTYLHALLHCILRHPLRTVRADTGTWSLACDICVEAIAAELCAERFALEDDRATVRLAAVLAARRVPITPAGIYRELLMLRKAPCDNAFLMSVAEAAESGRPLPFARDSHGPWNLVEPPKQNEEPEGQDGQDGHEGDEPGQPGSEPQEGSDEAGGDEAGSDSRGQEPEEQDADGAAPPAAGDESPATPSSPEPGSGDEDDWEAIARQLEAELATLEKERGDGAGRLTANLALANRSRIDYADFLRRFATRAEELKVNDEEFDYLFYTYGLARYGNMPLVEPLEYKEEERVREFVIAIDTSGSCSSGLTRLFLTRTYEILSRSGRRGDRVNIHVVQCDAEIQGDTVIESTDDLRKFERGFEVGGMGGTDFRPVFAYVDGLVAEHAFEDLRGLVYFTDGYGTFPERAPGYDVAFVFVEEEGRDRRVPPWAMKVVMDEETITQMR